MGGTSSRRRKQRNSRPRRPSRSPSPRRSALPPSVSTLAFDDRRITSGPGFELLVKSGWQPGQTLGAPSTPPARAAPIPIVVRRGRAGVGALTVPNSHSHSHSLPSDFCVASPLHQRSHRAPRPTHMANMHIFDPLRPRCQFDPTHVVPNLKALNKHEKSCPANPRRTSSPRIIVVPSAAPFTSSPPPARHSVPVPASPTSFGNQFSHLASSTASSSSSSLCSQVDSVLSDLSSLTAENDHPEHVPFVLDHPHAL
ncbi:unnamed protein product [Agarophyton chilense]